MPSEIDKEGSNTTIHPNPASTHSSSFSPPPTIDVFVVNMKLYLVKNAFIKNYFGKFILNYLNILIL